MSDVFQCLNFHSIYFSDCTCLYGDYPSFHSLEPFFPLSCGRMCNSCAWFFVCWSQTIDDSRSVAMGCVLLSVFSWVCIIRHYFLCTSSLPDIAFYRLPGVFLTHLCFTGLFCCCLFIFFRAAPAAYGGSQARGWIGAVATCLHHSHSDSRSPTHWARPGIRPTTSWFLVGFVNLWAMTGTLRILEFFNWT